MQWYLTFSLGLKFLTWCGYSNSFVALVVSDLFLDSEVPMINSSISRTTNARARSTSWSDVEPCTLLVTVQIPSGANLVAGGGIVYFHIEKNLLVCSTPKHRSKVNPVSRQLRFCVWVKVFFFLSTMLGGCLPPPVEFFFQELQTQSLRGTHINRVIHTCVG
jgi:hypothetical protein